MADVLSIAASMVARELEMTSMRLQKLLYYAHGCHLATHSEAPWRDARGELADDAWSNVAIPDESIRGFFTAALMSRNEPSQDEFGAALLSRYCEYAARRAFMPPVFRDADELDEWHRQLDDAPEHLDGLRSFMNAPSVFDPA